MEKRIVEPISEMLEKLTEIKRRPRSTFTPTESTRILLTNKESDINE